MSLWILISLIALFWLSYPIFGGIGVAALVASGERSDDAGFSFLPELIVLPIVFFGDCRRNRLYCNAVGQMACFWSLCCLVHMGSYSQYCLDFSYTQNEKRGITMR